MIDTITKVPSLRWMTEQMRLLLRRPVRQQIAALCHRAGKKGPEILLITSRDTKRWIIPKGWPMANHSARKTARIEAFEEAGIIGKAAKKPLGEISSYKGLGNGYRVRTNITVFPLKVEEQVDKFPEKGERDLAWLTLDEAIERCEEEGLKTLLRSPQVQILLAEGKDSSRKAA